MARSFFAHRKNAQKIIINFGRAKIAYFLKKKIAKTVLLYDIKVKVE